MSTLTIHRHTPGVIVTHHIVFERVVFVRIVLLLAALYCGASGLYWAELLWLLALLIFSVAGAIACQEGRPANQNSARPWRKHPESIDAVVDASSLLLIAIGVIYSAYQTENPYAGVLAVIVVVPLVAVLPPLCAVRRVYLWPRFVIVAKSITLVAYFPTIIAVTLLALM